MKDEKPKRKYTKRNTSEIPSSIQVDGENKKVCELSIDGRIRSYNVSNKSYSNGMLVLTQKRGEIVRLIEFPVSRIDYVSVTFLRETQVSQDLTNDTQPVESVVRLPVVREGYFPDRKQAEEDQRKYIQGLQGDIQPGEPTIDASVLQPRIPDGV